MEEGAQLGTPVIASRELVFTRSDGLSETVKVFLGAPMLSEHDDWLCPYLIQGMSFQKQFRMVGIDSMQALIHSVHILADELASLARKHDGKFTYLGDSELLLPLPESLDTSGKRST